MNRSSSGATAGPFSPTTTATAANNLLFVDSPTHNNLHDFTISSNNNVNSASNTYQDDTISLTDTSLSYGSDLLISNKPRVEERITSLVHSFKFNNSKSVIPHLLPLFTHGIVLPLQLIALGYMPFAQWGQIAHDINHYFMKTLITFGFHYIPHVAVVVLSAIVYVLHWLLIAHTYIEYKGFLVGFVKFKRRSKHLARYLIIFLFIFNMPITHLFSTFWSCDYTTSTNTSSFALRDYSGVECWEPLNAVFAALSVIHTVSQILIVLLFLFGVIETDSLSYAMQINSSGNNLLKRRASFFSSKTPVFISVTNLFIMLFYWYSQMIPNYSTFPYLFPSFSLLLFIVLAVLIFVMVPFNVRSENSYIAGILFGIVGQNIVSLICSTVNTDISKVDILSTNGIIYWGASIGAFIIFLIVGVSIMEVYTRRATKLLTKGCKPLVDSGMSEISLSPELMEEIGEGNLEMAIRFCNDLENARHRAISDEYNEPPPSTKCKIISAIIRGSIRNKSEYSSASVYLAVANYVRYHKLDQTQHHPKTNLNIALHLLKKMHVCKPSYFEKFVGSMRKSEIESQLLASLNISTDSEKSISKSLQHLTKKQSKLREFHKNFWKVVITNNENSLNELITINRKITKFTSHCKSKFENLIALYSYNKSALRPYAMFVEEFLFDKEKSKEILQLVAMIEEDEGQKLKSKQIALDTTSEKTSKRRRSRVVPAITVSECTSQMEDEKKPKFDDISEFDNQNDEDMLRKKQQDTYTKSIQRRSHITTTIVFTSFFPFVSLLVVIGGLIAAVMISNSFTGTAVSSSNTNSELSAYQNLCDTSPYPFMILCEMRLLQRHYYFDKDNATFARSYKITQQAKLTNYKSYLKSFLEQMSVTDKSGYLDLWEGQETEIYMPVISTTFNENSTMNYEKRNVTIKEIIELMDVHVDRAKDFTEAQVKQTLDNPSFLFFWQNRKYNAYALENVCSDVLTAKSNKVTNILNLFLYVMGASIAVFFLLGVITLFVLVDYFKKQQRIAHLFFMLPKEESGKIYHALEKVSASKLSQNIDSERTSLSITSYFTPTRTLLSLVIIVFMTALLAIVLYLVDTNNNLKNQEMALNKLYQASKVKVIFNRIMFKLGELLLMNDWKPLWGGLSSEIDRIHKDITTHSREVETYMKSYLYARVHFLRKPFQIVEQKQNNMVGVSWIVVTKQFGNSKTKNFSFGLLQSGLDVTKQKYHGSTNLRCWLSVLGIENTSKKYHVVGCWFKVQEKDRKGQQKTEAGFYEYNRSNHK